MSKDIYDALKNVMTIEARLEQVTQSVAAVSERLEVFSRRVTDHLGEQAQRLARLEGKFELIETTLGSRPKRLRGAGESHS